MTDIAANTSPDVKPGDIIARRVGESAENLKQKMRGKGKHKSAAPKWRKTQPKRGESPKKKATLTIKRDIFA